MDVFNKVGKFIAVTEEELKALGANELVLVFEHAGSCNLDLSLIGTPQEKVAEANLRGARAEVLRRLEMVRV